MTPAEMNAAVLSNLPQKTGKSIDQWVGVLADAGELSRKDQIAWLKSVHGLGHVTASIIADYSRNATHVQLAPDSLFDALQSKCSEAARNQLAELLLLLSSLPGVEVTPCKGYVGAKARRQFLAARPRAGRLEIALLLPDIHDADFHDVKGLGGGSLNVAIWGDQQFERWVRLAWEAQNPKTDKGECESN